MFKRILLCSDGSNHALKSAETAADLANAFRAELILLHVFVIPQRIPFAPPEGGLAVPAASAPSEEEQEQIVSRTLDILKRANVSARDLREVDESAPDTILRIAENEQADLIVLGSRGLSGISRFFLGSVSDRVLHHANCAVMIVR